MRREGPQDVLLAPHLSEVEPVRINVLQAAERALAHQFAQLDEGRVILQQMADHQPPPALLGKRAQPLGLRRLSGPAASRQRHACRLRCAPSQAPRAAPRAPRSRRRQCAGSRSIARAPRPARRTAPTSWRARRLIGVADRRQRAELGKIADQVLAPIAATDHRDPHRRSRLSRIVQQKLLPMLPQSG